MCAPYPNPPFPVTSVLVVSGGHEGGEPEVLLQGIRGGRGTTNIIIVFRQGWGEGRGEVERREGQGENDVHYK